MSTVYAVVKVTIEVPVRASSGAETVDELIMVSQKEAEEILSNNLNKCFKIISPVEFSHAIVKDR